MATREAIRGYPTGQATMAPVGDVFAAVLAWRVAAAPGRGRRIPPMRRTGAPCPWDPVSGADVRPVGGGVKRNGIVTRRHGDGRTARKRGTRKRHGLLQARVHVRSARGGRSARRCAELVPADLRPLPSTLELDSAELSYWSLTDGFANGFSTRRPSNRSKSRSQLTSVAPRVAAIAAMWASVTRFAAVPLARTRASNVFQCNGFSGGAARSPPPGLA